MDDAISLSTLLEQVFVFERYGEVLVLLQNSLYAGALVGLVGGIIGTFVMMRDLAFAVHGVSELSFAGGAIALLAGTSIVTGSLLGSVIAALLIGLLGARSRAANSVVGVLMPFGLGLGILALSLYQGRSANQFALLTGQIVSVSEIQLVSIAILSIVVLAGLGLLWRPLSFASLDPAVAQARGLPIRGLSIVFMLLLAVAIPFEGWQRAWRESLPLRCVAFQSAHAHAQTPTLAEGTGTRRRPQHQHQHQHQHWRV